MSTLKVNAITETDGSAFPFGKVLQAVSTVDSTANQSITSTSYVDAGSLSVSITPSSSSNKVLIMATVNVQCFASHVETNGNARLVRGSTELIEYPYAFVMEAGKSNSNRVFYNQNHTEVYLDSPSTTSSTTYKVQIRVLSSSNSNQVIYNQNSSKSVITVMEIAA
tara:strand:- start:893 stop:1390 length:498 start_codon:yes stop_codon:yes gene_type:complete